MGNTESGRWAAGKTLWRRREYVENNCESLGTAYYKLFRKWEDTCIMSLKRGLDGKSHNRYKVTWNWEPSLVTPADWTLLRSAILWMWLHCVPIVSSQDWTILQSQCPLTGLCCSEPFFCWTVLQLRRPLIELRYSRAIHLLNSVLTGLFFTEPCRSRAIFLLNHVVVVDRLFYWTML